MPPKPKRASKPKRSLHGAIRAPRKSDAVGKTIEEFAERVQPGTERLVEPWQAGYTGRALTERTSAKGPTGAEIEKAARRALSEQVGDAGLKPIEDVEREGMPLMDFEPQLARINRVLHYWLEQCHKARFFDPKDKFDAMAKMSKALHDNLKSLMDVIRLLHEMNDMRTFNRIVLDAIKACAPDVRIKIVQQLQRAKQEIRALKSGTVEAFGEGEERHG